MSHFNPVNGTPWVRDQEAAQCYFCGEWSTILSHGDMKTDPGRVEVYCKNPDCDAREVTVLIMNDSSMASHRRDVRALERIDSEGVTADSSDGAIPQVMSLREFLAEPDPPILQRRLGDLLYGWLAGKSWGTR